VHWRAAAGRSHDRRAGRRGREEASSSPGVRDTPVRQQRAPFCKQLAADLRQADDLLPMSILMLSASARSSSFPAAGPAALRGAFRRRQPVGMSFPTPSRPLPAGSPRPSSSGNASSGRPREPRPSGQHLPRSRPSRAAHGAAAATSGATIFGYYVSRPEAYGVIEFDAALRAVSIEEKPKVPKFALCRRGALLLRQRRGGLSRRAPTFGPRGEGDHRRQPRVLPPGDLSVKLMGRG